MIQIAFQPALDPYHTIYRLLRLLPTARLVGRLELNHVRILDFYLAFPFRLSAIRVRPEHRRFKGIAKLYDYAAAYGDIPEDQIIFDRMLPIQQTAIQHLAACKIISPSDFGEGWFTPIETSISEELVSRITAANQQDHQLMNCLGILALAYPLSGAGGLKERTRLMEHRYDAA